MLVHCKPFLSPICISPIFVFLLPHAYAACTGPQSVIFFGNGINTPKSDAAAAAGQLQRRVLSRLSQTGSAFNPECLSFRLAYDAQFWDSSNQVIDGVNLTAQLINSAEQRAVSPISDVWKWIDGWAPIPDWFADAWSAATRRVASVAQPNLIVHELKYREALRSGSNIIVVAHSQGNLYANQAFRLIFPSGNSGGNMTVIAVATPDESVPGQGPWFTLTNDIISDLPRALPPNINNAPPCSGSSISSRISCHSFSYSYLSGSNGLSESDNLAGGYSGPRIVERVINALPGFRAGSGSIGVAATLDDQPWNGSASYSVIGRDNIVIGSAVPGTSLVLSGLYLVQYSSGGPPGSTLIAIDPCPTSTVPLTQCQIVLAATSSTAVTLRFRSNTSQSPSADAVRDFSIASNPNGRWSYGYRNSLIGVFNLYTTAQPDFISNIDRWAAPAVDPNLGVARNRTTSPIAGSTFSYPPDMLHMHPGPQNRYAVVRWTAPTTGTFSIQGKFAGLDRVLSVPDTDVHVRINNQTALFSATLRGFGTEAPFTLSQTLSAGDIVEFLVGVGPSSAFQNDSTGLKVTIAGQ